jgi:predicted nucleic acid-binding protein
MIVVSDTSPINYLVLIELQDLLPELFQRVLIPDAVHRELQSTGAPDPIRRFLAEAPNWLEVRPSPEIDAALPHLDSGEREVIALALSTKADSVLLDERKGRQAARARGLLVSGTLGVIRRAADQGLITLTDALDRLEKTNFRATPKLFNSLRGSTTRSSP